MAHARRATAVVVLVFLASLTLVGSGYACAMPAAGDGAPMAGMADMTGGAAPDDGPAPPKPPCNFPWAPGGCEGMVPCAPSAMTSLSVPLIEVPRVEQVATVWTVTTPPSLSRVPELPPPRA
ncbi:MAG: hypothetical protein NVS1B4_24010 [Gemmatimonadaceae bacterium]